MHSKREKTLLIKETKGVQYVYKILNIFSNLAYPNLQYVQFILILIVIFGMLVMIK